MFKEGVIDHSQDWSTLVYETNRYAAKWEAVDKVSCSIYPLKSWRVSEK